MTVTTTRLGPNTNQISIAGELDSAAFLVALDAAIVAGGWIQHDIANPLYRVYKAINLDGITYKYASVSIDVYRQRFWLSCWESWNASTHVGTNESFTTLGGYWQPYTFSNCEVVVFASPRWLGFQTYIRNVPALHPVFVQETTRDHTQDTAAGGVPCFGWMTPANTSTVVPFGSGTATNIFSTPRNKAGNIGGLSARRSFLALEVARICSASFTPNGVSVFGNGLASALANCSGDIWDTNARYAQTIRVGHGYSEMQGRMAGLKASRIPAAGLMNRVSVPVDSKFLFDSAGTPTDHWVLPINTETPILASVGAVAIGSGFNQVYDAVWDGATLYMSRPNGFQRYNLDMGVLGSIIPATTGNGINMGFVFDGRYIYFAAGDRIGKWDTTTDAVTYSASAAGATMSRLCISGGFIWAMDKTAQAQNLLLRKYDMSLTLQLTATKAMGVSGPVGYDIAADSSGTLAFLVGSTSSATASKVWKLNPNAGETIGTSAAMTAAVNSAGTLCWMGTPGIFDAIFTPQNNGTTGGMFTVDASITTPVFTQTNSMGMTWTTINGANGSLGPFSGNYRYGRGVIGYSASGQIQVMDYEMGTNADSVITSVIGTVGWATAHFGTHILSMGTTQAVLVPVAGITTSPAGGQLLLPK